MTDPGRCRRGGRVRPVTPWWRSSTPVATVPGGAPRGLLRQRRHAVVRAPDVRPARLLHRRAQEAVARDPGVAERPEFAALLAGDKAAIGELGWSGSRSRSPACAPGSRPRSSPPRSATSWAGRCTRRSTVRCAPTSTSRCWSCSKCCGPRLHRRVVTGGGTEFVRAVSQDLYGVPPERVVGTLIEYDVLRPDGRPVAGPVGAPARAANEGAAKVSDIQTQLGRRPILAAGNSGGDRQMLEWARDRRGADPGAAGRPRRRRAGVQLRQHGRDLRRD